MEKQLQKYQTPSVLFSMTMQKMIGTNLNNIKFNKKAQTKAVWYIFEQKMLVWSDSIHSHTAKMS